MHGSFINNAGRVYYKKAKNMARYALSIFDNKPKVAILAYHRVLPRVDFNPLRNTVATELFTRQIEALSKAYPLVSLADVVRQCNNGDAKFRNQIVLTFDDGYCDNYSIISFILRRRGVPATFFINTDYIGSNMPLWDTQLLKIINCDEDIQKITIKNEDMQKRPNESRLSFALRVFRRMKSLAPAQIHEILERLRSASSMNSAAFLPDRCMSWDEVKEMKRCGMEIGSHGASHCSLANMPFDEAQDEIMRSKRMIETEINTPCASFAFPFGSKKDYSSNLIDFVKEAGFKACLLNIQGYNHLRNDIFCFYRITMDETTDVTKLLG